MSEKQHPPSRRALRLARQRGEVAYSADVASTAVFVAVTGSTVWLAASALDALAALWRDATTRAVFTDPERHLPALALQAGHVAGMGMLLLVMITLCAAVAGGVVQVGGLMAWERVLPDVRQLNPAQGLTRLFSMRNLVNLLKLLLKTSLLAALMVTMLRSTFAVALGLGVLPPVALVTAAGQVLLVMMAWAALIYALIAGLDHWHQRHEFIRQHRMSHQDLRQDRRDAEGDPLNQSRRRSAYFEAVYLGLADRVRAASVVVVSPRVAVAVQYLGDDDLPRVIARGEGEMASRIRQLAEPAQVSVIDDAGLAERLYADAPIDQHIPAALHEPVAQLLRRAAGPAP